MEKISTQKLPELVIDSFFNAIEKGDIKLGEVLASEREIAEEFEISRGTLREGLSILEFLGVIRNKGNKKIVEKDYNTVRTLLELSKISEKDNIVFDYFEFRKIIELENIRLACEKATEEDLNEIHSIIEELKSNGDSNTNDYKFHVGIAKAGKNEFLISITQLLLNMTDSIRGALIDYPGRKPFMEEECINIYEAIKEKNIKKAQDYFMKHLFFIESSLKAINSLED